jgi:hypothetical protein
MGQSNYAQRAIMDKTATPARAVLAWLLTDDGPALEAGARTLARGVAVTAAAAVVATAATYRAGARFNAALLAASDAFAADPAAAALDLVALLLALLVTAWHRVTAPAPAVAPAVVPAPVLSPIGARAAALAALKVAELRSLARVEGHPRSTYRTARRSELLAILAGVA